MALGKTKALKIYLSIQFIKKYIISHEYIYNTVTLVNNIHEEHSFMYLSDDLSRIGWH
jgi:hypothetical protein